MSAASPVSSRRYRRRILALGALTFSIAFAIGAAIFVPIVQNDLEDRVEAELVEYGVEGVTASFSGQDGTLVCAQPLDDPEGSRALAAELWGVRRVSLDRTCLADDPTADEPTADEAAADAAPVESTVTEVTTPATDAPVVTEPGLDSIADLVSGDPLFSQLAGLIEVAGLDGADGLRADGPLTVFAPTDAAFDAAFDELGADAFGALTSDPEMLRTLLLHHLTDGRITEADLVSGSLTMLDGTDIEIDAETLTFTSGSSVAGVADPGTQLDIEASNGVVHAIDRILVPPGLELAPGADRPASTATFDGGVMVLSGPVSSEDQRAQLRAAGGALDPANVVDELTVDAAAAPTAADIDRLAVVVEAMTTNLVAGTASLSGSELRLDGVVRDAEARTAIEELGASTDVVVELSARPVADAESAQQLEDALNEFVAANPITFEPGSIELTAEAAAVIQQIAARALALDAVDIVVVGHTDTDGSAETNQFLSDGRALAVRDALVDLGLDGDALSAEGRGETEPVLDADGTEDKPASRRVEFIVAAR